MRRRDARPPSPLPWILASAVVLGALAFAAARLSRPDPATVTLDAAAWATTVRPMLASRCGACHSDASRPFRLAPSPTAAEVIDELARARAWIVPGDPSASELLLRARGERHPAVLTRGRCVDRSVGRWISGSAPARCPDREE